MADLVVDGVLESGIDLYYHGKFSRSLLIDDAYEAEDFFPAFGEGGRWLFFTAAALRNAEGEVIGAIETLQDITERRRAEAALREKEAYLAQIVEGSFGADHGDRRPAPGFALEPGLRSLDRHAGGKRDRHQRTLAELLPQPAPHAG
jgi:PAS domain-containing protein